MGTGIVIESKSKLELVKRALLSHMVMITTKISRNVNPPATDIDAEIMQTDELIGIIDSKLEMIDQKIY